MIELLKKICKILDNQSIDYMLSGSLALNIYSLPRMTRDIDLVVKMKKEDIDKFVTAVELDFYCYKPGIEEEVERKGMFNLIDNKTSIKIDFIVCKDTAYRQTEFSRRQVSNILGFESWVVTIEDLILSKLIWIQDLQSEKQITDIKGLSDNTSIDWQYIRYWISELGLNTLGII